MASRSTRSSSSRPSTPQQNLELTESEISSILASASKKPSSINQNNKFNKDEKPLIILSPEELSDIVENDKKLDGIGEEEEEGLGDEEKVELWEELLTDLFWSIPFGFLYYGMWVLF